MTKKRTIALLTAVSITFSPAASVLANAEAIPSEEKQYVIVTEDKEIYDEISEEVMENIAADSSVLEENRIIVAELTESEAVALDAEKMYWWKRTSFFPEALQIVSQRKTIRKKRNLQQKKQREEKKR